MQAGALPVSTTVAAIVLGGVLVIGVTAGRAKSRWMLLLAGLVAVLVLAIAVVAAVGLPAGDSPAAKIIALYQLAVPLGVAFVAGWLCARGSWLRRLLVLGVAALLLASFPYVAAAQATASTLLTPEVSP